jgi:hypothetical protein
MRSEVWSSALKLYHEYHDYRNQQSVSRTIPPDQDTLFDHATTLPITAWLRLKLSYLPF